MQVQFKNALFGLEDYDFAVVDESSLIIVLKTREIVLEFDNEAEALAAQAELGKVIDAAKKETVSVVDMFEEVAGVVSNALGGLFGAITAKATKTTASFEERAEKMAADIEEVLTTVTNATRPARNTAAEANDVFGTTRSTKPASETVVADLSDDELRSAIDAKVAQLIANDPRVQALVEELRSFYSDADVEEVIEIRKQQVFAVARENDELTVNEVFARILRNF